MRKFSYLRAIYLSLYSRELYRDVVQNWRGLGFKYLMLALFLSWLLVAVRLHMIVGAYLDDFVLPVVAALPQMRVVDGVMQIDRPVPYQVVDPRDGRQLVRFELDTDAREPGVAENGIFVFRTGMLLQYQGRQKEVKFNGSWETPLRPHEWRGWLITGRNWVAPLVLMIFWSSTLVLTGFQALILGLVGKLLAVLNKRLLSYPQLVRLSVVGLTPALLLDTFQKLSHLMLPSWPLISIVLTIGYLTFAVRVSPSSMPPAPDTSAEAGGRGDAARTDLNKSMKEDTGAC